MAVKLNTKEVLKRFNSLYGYKYIYPNFVYKNSNQLIKIVCHEHGTFYKSYNVHYNQKIGCKKCSGEKKGLKRRHKIQQILKRFKEIHSDRYDYSDLIERGYKNAQQIFYPYCKIHKESHPTNYSSHGNRQSKLICCSQKRSLTNEIVDQKLKDQGRNHLIYRKENLIDSRTDILWGCYICYNEWAASPQNIVNNQTGCPKCDMPKGEVKTEKCLKELGIEYITQHKFPDCKDKRELRFDFYIPKLNLCIEYNGPQHYNSRFHIWIYGEKKGLKEFTNQQKHDKMKRKYCKENNINFFVISYKNFKNIEKIIEEKLNLDK